MFDSPSSFTLVSGLVGAGGYGPPLTAKAAVSVPLKALVEIHRARVEIYCGHNAQAVAGIRAAGRQLRDSSAHVPAATFAALEEAAWLARNDHYVRAELALDEALAHMAALLHVA